MTPARVHDRVVKHDAAMDAARERKKKMMPKVGDTVFRCNGLAYDKGVVVRIVQGKCLVNFGSYTATVSPKNLHTPKQIRRRSIA